MLVCPSVPHPPHPGNPVCSHTIELSGPLGWRRTIRRGALASSRVMFFKRLTNLSGRGAATALGPSLKQSQEVRSNTGGKKASACRGECFPPNYPNDSVLMRRTLTSSSQLASKTGQTSLCFYSQLKVYYCIQLGETSGWGSPLDWSATRNTSFTDTKQGSRC